MKAIVLFIISFQIMILSAGIINFPRTQGSINHSSQKKPLIVIAHRGDHVHVPENTLAAFQQAIAAGADYVEVDLRTSKDGHLVIMHDATVDRMTNGKGEINDLTYREIKKLIIKGKNGDQRVYHVPDFKSVLKTCKGHINIYLDFKDANVQKTYDLIKKFDMQDHVAVYLNQPKQYDEWKKTAPQIPLIASIPEKMDVKKLDSFLDKKKVNIIDNAYEESEIEFLHSRGIRAWLDAEEEKEDSTVWQKIIQAGADGIQTDHPEKLIQYLKRHGLK